MFTFAYGGNLDITRMRKIAPDIRFICRAYLPDHTIGFPILHEGIPQIGAVAKPGAKLWGVVYDIPDGPQVEALDKAEGIIGGHTQSGYRRVSWSVIREDNPVMRAHAYVADGGGDYVPDHRYMARVLDWAQFWSLPDEHLEVLKRHLAQSQDWGTSKDKGRTHD